MVLCVAGALYMSAFSYGALTCHQILGMTSSADVWILCPLLRRGEDDRIDRELEYKFDFDRNSFDSSGSVRRKTNQLGKHGFEALAPTLPEDPSALAADRQTRRTAHQSQYGAQSVGSEQRGADREE